ncbi:RpiR family transcriptional regulator [Cupriavidus necator]|uniref:RpiR family transcriptional regulator n=1 Tax=Cupriavidus necator TaxID=106590 RepID=A0A1U9UV59_CUPNE|nr:MurR/RpiR family transcriptional regulator [Cupriavidus necator]AQV96576.1 RpiR family transcriptional regulator [Cupriavidus necator]
MKQSVRELLISRIDTFTASEKKIAQVLLDKYPSAGLTSISELAKSASVSDPTVLRLVVKLNFVGYSAFQRALLDEIDATMSSPIERARAFHLTKQGFPPVTHISNIRRAIETFANHLDPFTFEAGVNLLLRRESTVFVGGGSYSSTLAAIFARDLQYVRSGVKFVELMFSKSSQSLIEINPGDVLIVFDFRRYERSVIEYAIVAKDRGAKILLLTDQWTSPIGKFADVVFRIYAESFSLIDTKVPALTLCEIIVTSIVDRIPDEVRSRLEEIESLRNKSSYFRRDGEAVFQSIGVDDPNGLL